MKIDCLTCEHWRGGHLECKFEFRSAANAGGGAADRKDDVWFCLDYEETRGKIR